jgi:hypothetical protein
LNVGAGWGLGNDNNPFATQIEGRCGLDWHNSQDLHAFHVLLNVSTELGASLGSGGEEAGSQRPLGQLRTSGTPSGNISVNAGDFNLDSTRHSPDNLVGFARRGILTVSHQIFMSTP